MKHRQVISELSEIRNKILSSIEENDLILAKFGVNHLDNFIYKYYQDSKDIEDKLNDLLNYVKSDLAEEEHQKLTKVNSEYKIKFLKKIKEIIE